MSPSHREPDHQGLEGHGACRQVLGSGPDGMFGHVEVRLSTTPNSGQYQVEWLADSEGLASDARPRIVAETEKHLSQHLDAGENYGFHLTVLRASSDPIRRNDYERATWIAIRDALVSVGLPVPQIFGP